MDEPNLGTEEFRAINSNLDRLDAGFEAKMEDHRSATQRLTAEAEGRSNEFDQLKVDNSNLIKERDEAVRQRDALVADAKKTNARLEALMRKYGIPSVAVLLLIGIGFAALYMNRNPAAVQVAQETPAAGFLTSLTQNSGPG